MLVTIGKTIRTPEEATEVAEVGDSEARPTAETPEEGVEEGGGGAHIVLRLCLEDMTSTVDSILPPQGHTGMYGRRNARWIFTKTLHTSFHGCTAASKV